MAVAIEVASDQVARDVVARGRLSPARLRGVDCGLKRAIAVAQEQGDIAGVWVGDGQVEMAVAEVARDDGTESPSIRDRRG
jgi:hypothetical protein